MKAVGKLKWLLQNEKNIKNESVLAGFIDSWILWKLTKEQKHATEVTCAATTGLYDPYWVLN